MNCKSNNILRVTLALFSLAYSYGHYSAPGSFSSVFISYPSVRYIEKYIGPIFILLAFTPKRYSIKNLLLLFSGTLLFEASFKFIQLSPLENLLSPFTSAIRIVFPLMLVFETKLHKVVLIACALTFFGHGIEAIMGAGKFIDFFLYCSKVFGLSDFVNEEKVLIILKLIGLFDIVSAILIFSKFRVNALRFMMFWGFITAAMRLVYYDFSLMGFSEFFLRIPHWIIPSLLLFYKNEH
jgi:hypothetical protein